MKIYTTLKRIEDWLPCEDGLQSLQRVLGKGHTTAKRIYAEDVVRKDLDIKYVLWGLRCVPQSQREYVTRMLVAFSCDCAEHVLHHFEEKFPSDNRPLEAIEAARRWLKGGCIDVASNVAWDTARDIVPTANAWGAAMNAVKAAAWALDAVPKTDSSARDVVAVVLTASKDAAWAAQDAAWAAQGDRLIPAKEARNAEKDWQRNRLLEYLTESPVERLHHGLD